MSSGTEHLITYVTYGDAAVRMLLMLALAAIVSLAWGGYLQPRASPPARAALRQRGKEWLPTAWLGLIGSLLILLGARGIGVPLLTLASDIIATGFYLSVFLRGIEAMEIRDEPAAPDAP